MSTVRTIKGQVHVLLMLVPKVSDALSMTFISPFHTRRKPVSWQTWPEPEGRPVCVPASVCTHTLLSGHERLGRHGDTTGHAGCEHASRATGALCTERRGAQPRTKGAGGP